jgi:hypothetical protein
MLGLLHAAPISKDGFPKPFDKALEFHQSDSQQFWLVYHSESADKSGRDFLASVVNHPDFKGLLKKYQFAAVIQDENRPLSDWLAACALSLEAGSMPHFLVLTPNGRPVLGLTKDSAKTPDFRRALEEVVTMAKVKPQDIEKAASEVVEANGGKSAWLLATKKPDKSNPSMKEWGTGSAETHPLSVQARLKGLDTNYELQLDFSIESGFHINSATPNQDWLIPTSVTGAAGIRIQNITWPKGHDLTFEFSDEPVSVYEGQFTIFVTGDYEKEAVPAFTIRFQACSESECLPPQSMELHF